MHHQRRRLAPLLFQQTVRIRTQVFAAGRERAHDGRPVLLRIGSTAVAAVGRVTWVGIALRRRVGRVWRVG